MRYFSFLVAPKSVEADQHLNFFPCSPLPAPVLSTSQPLNLSTAQLLYHAVASRRAVGYEGGWRRRMLFALSFQPLNTLGTWAKPLRPQPLNFFAATTRYSCIRRCRRTYRFRSAGRKHS